MSLLKDKVGIITGAAEGIGLSIAAAMLNQGAKILINDLNQKSLKSAQESLKQHQSTCIFHAGDASDKDLVYEMVDRVCRKFGPLSLVVANAGITHAGPFADFPEDKLVEMLNLNIKGSFFLAQTASRSMIHHHIGGRIIFLSSVTGVQAHKGMEGYGMTKAALRMLARNLAPELGPHGITVNCIAPGATLTPRTLNIDPDYAKDWSKVTPTGTPATTDDIAAACLFLLGPQARHINGQTIIVDGGWTNTSPLPDHM